MGKQVTIRDMVDHAGISKFGLDTFRLYGLARYQRAMNIVELGTQTGASTSALLLAAQENGGSLVSVDIDPRCAKIFDGYDSWRFVAGDSTTPEVAEKAGNHSIDFLFIDSSHKAEQTTLELALWLPRLVIDGIAVFHDVKICKAGVQTPILAYILKDKDRWHYYEYADSQYGLGVLGHVG